MWVALRSRSVAHRPVTEMFLSREELDIRGQEHYHQAPCSFYTRNRTEAYEAFPLLLQ